MRTRVLQRERPAIDTLQLELPPRGISLESVEKELIVRALEKFDGNQTSPMVNRDVSSTRRVPGNALALRQPPIWKMD